MQKNQLEKLRRFITEMNKIHEDKDIFSSKLVKTKISFSYIYLEEKKQKN